MFSLQAYLTLMYAQVALALAHPGLVLPLVVEALRERPPPQVPGDLSSVNQAWEFCVACVALSKAVPAAQHGDIW